MIDYRNNNKWTVYIHVSPSNKYYVGITSIKPSNRWRNGGGYKYNNHFYNAIQKYGWNNFEHLIFAENLTKEEACDMEKFLIKNLNSCDKNYGYNVSHGGEYGRFGLTLSEETKEKIRKSNKGKVISEETRRKISENHSDVSYGKNPNSMITYQFNEDGTFITFYDSVSRASEITKIDSHSISVAAVNNRMAGGYLWAHDDNVVYENDTYTIKNNTYIDKRYVLFNKEVFQFTTDGVFINKYESCAKASKITGISRGTISYNAKNKSRSNKYIWRYRKDVIESTENVGSFFII